MIRKEGTMKTLDYLPNHKNIKIYQDDEMLRINTDTMVLGEFLNIYRNDTVLDIGTNNGALLLYASRFSPKKMIGVEINQKGVDLAKENMNLNNITNADIICEDILKYNGDEVDVIICNPPYFKTLENNKCQNEYKSIAKHEGILNLKNLIKLIKKNLKDGGTLFFLFVTPRLDEVLMELNTNNIIPKVIKFVYDNNKNFSNVFLIKAVKNAKKGLIVEKPVIIKR